MVKFNYKPMPDEVTVKKSNIAGLGIFALEPLYHHYILGVTHHFVDWEFMEETHEYIRTPLGGFLNHSDTPNCVLVPCDPGMYTLMTLRNISPGEELTELYTLEQDDNL